MIYYIGDMHMGHKNVLRFDSRPFPDMDEMCEVLIRNWNGRVTEKDTVYVLGDAFWKSENESLELFQRLNGHKHLVRGNHDRVHGRLGKCWESVTHYSELNDGNTLVILCHYPIMFYRNQHYGAVMLYGHVHNSREAQMVEKWKREQWAMGIPGRLINVGCMMPYMDYTPRSLAELLVANPMPEFARIRKDGTPAENQEATDTGDDSEVIRNVR
jgi:calcineurin-like phosphoesterase family protein